MTRPAAGPVQAPGKPFERSPESEAEPPTTRTLRIGEVAALAGVTIRTLRHYDQIGLLRPSGRTESGYRLYGELDLLRMQQILTLRYLGFSLPQISALLARPDLDPVEALRAQRASLLTRASEIERITSALTRLLERRAATGRWEWGLASDVIGAARQGLDNTERRANMTSDERQRQWDALGKEVTPEEIKAVERGWAELLGEVRASYALDPASPQAQALDARWDALLAATFRGHTELMEGVAAGYQRGEFDAVEGAPRPEDFAFIARVHAARAGS